MQKRKIYSTHDEIPLLGFGAMRFPTKNGLIDRKESKKLIEHSINQGANFIDTAYLYHGGESEIFLGELLSESGLRDKVLLSTKLPVWLVKKEEDLEKYLDEQLYRLKTDYLDYYFLHSLNKETFDFLKTINVEKFLDKIKESGKVKHVGFSYHDNYDSFCEIIDSYPWDMCLVQYNLIDEDVQVTNKGVEYADGQGVNVIVMEPLKGGLLVNKLPQAVMQTMKNNNITESPAKWALKWVINNPHISCVLSGMKTTSQIDENVDVCNNTCANQLRNDELKVYSEVKKMYNALLKIQCTQCNYCKPCPFNVDIPTCFELYNHKHLFNDRALLFTYYFRTSGVTGGVPMYAGLCKKCKKCMKHCPQKIDIISELEKVKKEFELPGYKYIAPTVLKIGMPLSKVSTKIWQTISKYLNK